MTAFEALFGKLTSKLVVTLMKGCFATRLVDPFLRVWYVDASNSASEMLLDLGRAADVCAVLLRQALQPNMFSYKVLISASEKDHAILRAVDVCAETLRQAMEPNIASHNALVSACGKGQELRGHSTSERRCCAKP